MTSSPFGSNWLINFASGRRAAGASFVSAGFVSAGFVGAGRVVRCCVTTSPNSVDGASKQRSSKRIEKRFTDNPTVRSLILAFDSSDRQIDVANMRVLCWREIHKRGVGGRSFVIGHSTFLILSFGGGVKTNNKWEMSNVQWQMTTASSSTQSPGPFAARPCDTLLLQSRQRLRATVSWASPAP